MAESRRKARLEGMHATETLQGCVGRGRVAYPGGEPCGRVSGKAGPAEEVTVMLVRGSGTTDAAVTLSLRTNVRFWFFLPLEVHGSSRAQSPICTTALVRH